MVEMTLEIELDCIVNWPNIEYSCCINTQQQTKIYFFAL